VTAFLKVFASHIKLGFDFRFAGSRAEDGTRPVRVDMVGGSTAPTLAGLMVLNGLLGYTHVVGQLGMERVGRLDFLLSYIPDTLQIQFSKSGC
jgi:hypothetical protein